MFLTNDQIYHRLLKEGVKKIERGVIENKDERDCLVYTNLNTIYYLSYDFFDKYNIDALFEEANNGQIFVGWDIWKNKKAEAMRKRDKRLKENKIVKIQ